MLEDIKPQLGELKTKLDQMGESLEVPAKEEKIAELEYKMGEPTFWDDAEKAQKINQELNDVKISVDKYKNLVSKFEDAQTLWEMGMEEQDESMEDDVKAELASVAEGLEALQLEVLLRPVRCQQCHPDAARRCGRNRGAGLDADAAAHVRPLGRAPRLHGRDG